MTLKQVENKYKKNNNSNRYINSDMDEEEDDEFVDALEDVKLDWKEVDVASTQDSSVSTFPINIPFSNLSRCESYCSNVDDNEDYYQVDEDTNVQSRFSISANHSLLERKNSSTSLLSKLSLISPQSASAPSSSASDVISPLRGRTSQVDVAMIVPVTNSDADNKEIYSSSEALKNKLTNTHLESKVDSNFESSKEGTKVRLITVDTNFERNKIKIDNNIPIKKPESGSTASSTLKLDTNSSKVQSLSSSGSNINNISTSKLISNSLLTAPHSRNKPLPIPEMDSEVDLVLSSDEHNILNLLGQKKDNDTINNIKQSAACTLTRTSSASNLRSDLPPKKRKIALPSNPFDNEELRRLQRWIHCFVAVTFDLEIGQRVELVYPVPNDTGSGVKPPLLTNSELKTVAFSAFPDSNSTAHVGDTIFSFRFRKNDLGYFIQNSKAPSYLDDEFEKESSNESLHNSNLIKLSEGRDISTDMTELIKSENCDDNNEDYKQSDPAQIFLYEDYLDSTTASPTRVKAASDMPLYRKTILQVSPNRSCKEGFDNSSDQLSVVEEPKFSLRRGSFNDTNEELPVIDTSIASKPLSPIFSPSCSDGDNLSVRTSSNNNNNNTARFSTNNRKLERSSSVSSISSMAAANSNSLGYMYAYVFFRQRHDPSLKRGYFQKSLVLLSRHPWHGLFTELLCQIGPKFMDLAIYDRDIEMGPSDGVLGTTMEYSSNSEVVKLLQRICSDIIYKWPQTLQASPVLARNALATPAVVLEKETINKSDNNKPLKGNLKSYYQKQRSVNNFYAYPRGIDDYSFFLNSKVTLPLLGFKKEYIFPPDGLFPLFNEIPTRIDTSFNKGDSFSFDMPTLSNPGKFFEIFSKHLDLLWICWELVLTGSSIMVMADTPRSCSEVVWCLTELIKPIPFGSDIRPYFTIQDSDAKLIAHRNAPPPSGTIIGVTNPVFVKMIDKWGAVLHVERVVGTLDKKNNVSPYDTINIVGYDGKHRSYLMKDKRLTKQTIEDYLTGKSPEALSNSLRRYFVDLTEQFLQPLRKYFNNELLVKGPESITFDYLRKTPEIKPFHQDSFLDDIIYQRKDYASSLGILPKISKRPVFELYKAFLKTSNFALWLQSMDRKIQSRWRMIYLDVLSSTDKLTEWLGKRFTLKDEFLNYDISKFNIDEESAYDDLTGGLAVVECIDVLLRIREEISKSEVRYSTYNKFETLKDIPDSYVIAQIADLDVGDITSSALHCKAGSPIGGMINKINDSSNISPTNIDSDYNEPGSPESIVSFLGITKVGQASETASKPTTLVATQEQLNSLYVQKDLLLSRLPLALRVGFKE